jgi:hypothetical protein
MWKNKLFTITFIVSIIIGILPVFIWFALPFLMKSDVHVTGEKGITQAGNNAVGGSMEAVDSGKQGSTPKLLDPDEVMDIAVERALSKLPKGDLYHTVPLKMKVQKQSILEAGITPKISQKLLGEIKKSPYLQMKHGVQYSPSGVQMQLITRKEDFEVLPLHMQEKQRILKEIPGKWKWLVTPLKSGKRLVTIQAIVYVKNPANKEKESFPYEVFSQEISIESDPAYSFNQFLTTNWDKVIGLIIGSGSLASGATWWLGQRKTKAKPQSEPQEKEAVAGPK